MTREFWGARRDRGRIHARLALVVIAALGAGLWLLPRAAVSGGPAGGAPGVLPVGAIVAWHPPDAKASAAPDGWQRCDGSAIVEPGFVARYGAGRHTPNLNGAAKPASGQNAGRPAFLRGAATSPVDGYGGADERLHRHDLGRHTHTMPHAHGTPHRHAVPHTHRVSLRTDSAGRMMRVGDGRSFVTLADRHQHTVNGQTGQPEQDTTRGPDRARSEGPDRLRTDVPTPPTSGAATLSTVPRHFGVVYIMRVR